MSYEIKLIYKQIQIQQCVCVYTFIVIAVKVFPDWIQRARDYRVCMRVIAHTIRVFKIWIFIIIEDVVSFYAASASVAYDVNIGKNLETFQGMNFVIDAPFGCSQR